LERQSRELERIRLSVEKIELGRFLPPLCEPTPWPKPPWFSPALDRLTAAIDLAAVDHFRRIARNGAHPAASNGERIANRLAVARNRLGDDLALLDSSSITGACQLIQLMAGPWATDEGKAAVFRVVRQAAGKR
jgi:hypothetical protein